MKISFESRFIIGDFCYLKTDPDQTQAMITGILIRPHGIMYEVSRNGEVCLLDDIELTKEKDVTKIF